MKKYTYYSINCDKCLTRTPVRNTTLQYSFSLSRISKLIETNDIEIKVENLLTSNWLRIVVRQSQDYSHDKYDFVLIYWKEIPVKLIERHSGDSGSRCASTGL